MDGSTRSAPAGAQGVRAGARKAHVAPVLPPLILPAEKNTIVRPPPGCNARANLACADARRSAAQPQGARRVEPAARVRACVRRVQGPGPSQPAVCAFLPAAGSSLDTPLGGDVAGRAPTTPGGGRRVYGGSRVRGGGGHKLMHSGNPCRRAKTIRSPISPSVNRMLPPRPSSVGTLCLRLLAALAPACPGLPLCHRLYSPSSPLHSHRLCRADHKQSWPLHSKRTRAS
jgi:hypothetical protein